MDIELWSGDSKALISREGAWLTNLSDQRGDILYPKRLLRAPDGSQKARGGLHTCLPNFGPGGSTELPQHGFARTSLWELADQTITSATLVLTGVEGEYTGLYTTLAYDLGETKLTVSLSCENRGPTALRIAPGFHPYFALASGEDQVSVSGQKLELDDLAGTLFESGSSRVLTSTRRIVTVQSPNLPTWAIWTDRLGDYVCVEPTLAGYAFLNDKPSSGEMLEPGQTETYSMSVSWQ